MTVWPGMNVLNAPLGISSWWGKDQVRGGEGGRSLKMIKSPEKKIEVFCFVAVFIINFSQAPCQLSSFIIIHNFVIWAFVYETRISVRSNSVD